ncbi:MAG: AMP-binding protein [Proteobacteria bacterium]|nr:AMP-binding protein [Pseudomonadota bacterium]MBU1715700.1 AMP-binding protein [Pseudomonadota bacterium]
MKHNFDLDTAINLRRSPPEMIAGHQKLFLRAHLKQAAKAPFYREMFKKQGCALDDLSLENLSSLPLTTRNDVESNPEAFFAAPPEKHVDLTLTSGSTGDPVLVPYTACDLERLAFNEQINFYGAGIRENDRLLLCVTLDRCFVAGLAYYSGLIKLGAASIRSGPAQPARQWELINRLKPSGLVGVPSFLLKMANWGESHGYNPKNNGIKTLVTIGEPIRRADNSLTPLGQELADAWQGRIFASYGATELETAFCECKAGCGGHVHPELMITEIVDDQGNLVPDGTAGEVVVTPLGVEGFTLVRFRTGDIARLHSTPCECGWQTPRLGAIEGRLAQRLKVKGTTLYPEMIFQALQDLPEVKASYLEVRSLYDLSDNIQVVVGVDNLADIKIEKISDHLQAHLRVKPEITIMDRGVVQETMEKAGGRKLKRFFDFRGE